MSKSTVRIGLVQPHTYYGEEEPRNLEEALSYVAKGAALGVDLLVFPENYPGPYRNDGRFEVIEPLCRAAAAQGVAIAAGTSLEHEPGSGTYSIATVMIGADGEIVGVNRRTHPEGPYIYEGGDLWDFTYEENNELPPVFDMGWGKVGVVTCSEVYVPELARSLAMRGAEICLFPTGILIDELGYTENWRTLIRARAIENLMYSAITVNLFSPEFADRYRQGGDLEVPPSSSGLTRGIAMIASPESVIATSEAPGIICGDLDLERIRGLRDTTEELIVPAPYKTIPGILDWPRPDLLGSARRREVRA